MRFKSRRPARGRRAPSRRVASRVLARIRSRCVRRRRARVRVRSSDVRVASRARVCGFERARIRDRAVAAAPAVARASNRRRFFADSRVFFDARARARRAEAPSALSRWCKVSSHCLRTRRYRRVRTRRSRGSRFGGRRRARARETRARATRDARRCARRARTCLLYTSPSPRD